MKRTSQGHRGRLSGRPVFADAPLAVLALTEARTRLANEFNPVPDAVFDGAAKHDDDQASAAGRLVAAMNA